MASIHLNLPDGLIKKIESAARKKSALVDDYIERAIEDHFDATSLPLRIGKVLLASFATALLVLLFLWLLNLPSSAFRVTSDIVWMVEKGLDKAANVLRIFAPWPITIIVLAVIFARSRSAFAALLGMLRLFRKVSLFGAEIELSSESRLRLQAATDDINLALAEYGKRVNREVSQLVTKHQLEHLFEKFLENSIFAVVDRAKLDAGFRATIHIPHPIRSGYLFQLLDYVPGGEGAHRGFPTRYGIIGKVWRSGEPDVVGNLFSVGGAPAPTSRLEKLRIIVRDWGMTRQEAERALNKPSYLCFLLEHQNERIGLVYMDSSREDAFISKVTGKCLTEIEVTSLIIPKAVTLAGKIALLASELPPAGIRMDGLE